MQTIGTSSSSACWLSWVSSRPQLAGVRESHAHHRKSAALRALSRLPVSVSPYQHSTQEPLPSLATKAPANKKEDDIKKMTESMFNLRPRAIELRDRLFHLHDEVVMKQAESNQVWLLVDTVYTQLYPPKLNGNATYGTTQEECYLRKSKASRFKKPDSI